MIDQDSFVEDTALLIQSACEQALTFKATDWFKESTRKQLAKTWELAGKTGFLKTFSDHGATIGTLAYYEWFHPHFMADVGEILVVHKPGETNGANWAIEQLRHHDPDFKAPITLLNIHVGNLEIFDECIEIGFRPNSIQIQGEVGESIERLEKKYGSIPKMKDLGLKSRPTEESDVDQIVAMKKEFFQKNPGYCWFFNNEGFPEFERQSLTKKIAEKTVTHFVFEDDQGFAGSMAHDQMSPDHPSGVDFMIAPRWHGKGVGKSAYKQLLESMNAFGYEHFTGFTANPGVLKLGLTMGRQMLSCHLIRGLDSVFDVDHFRPYLI